MGEFPKLGNHEQQKPPCPIPREEVIQLMKDRLRACWWGPRVNQTQNQNDSTTAASLECATPTGGVSRRSKENALFLGVIIAVILTTVNVSILMGMREVATRHLGLSADL